MRRFVFVLVACSPATQRSAVEPSADGPAQAAEPTFENAPNHWRYKVSLAGRDEHRVVWEGDPNETTRVLESVTASSDGDARTAERMQLVKSPSGIAHVASAISFESSNVSALDESAFQTPLVIMPAQFAIGATWTVTSPISVAKQRTIRASNHRSTSEVRGTIEQSGEVVRSERIVVHAGTFDCFVVRSVKKSHLEEVGTVATVTDDTTMTLDWYAPSIGLVRSESSSSIDVKRGASVTKHTVTATVELRSYHVRTQPLLAPTAGPPPAPVGPVTPIEPPMTRDMTTASAPTTTTSDATMPIATTTTAVIATNRRTLALGLAGGAAASIVAGSVLGLVARGRWNDAKTSCGGDVAHCPATELAVASGRVDSARNFATASTVAFVIGGALAVAGGVVWFTAPRDHGVAVAPTVDAHGAGASLLGRW
jgi:hypothetical protein